MTAVGVFSAPAWPLRLLRSATAAAASATLAVAGHRLGGGTVLAGWQLVLAFGLVLSVTLPLSTRRLTTGQIVGLLLVGQLTVHVCCALDDSMAAMTPAMLAAHVLATAVTTIVLVHGERAAWSLAERLGPRALAFLFFPLERIQRFALAPALRRDLRGPHRRDLVSAVGLRGPPLGG